MKMTYQLPLLLLILLSLQLKAQQSNNTLTLTQAWHQADQTYPLLTEREALIGEYQLRKQEVQSRSVPQLQLQVQNSYGTFAGSNGAFFPVPGVFNVTGNAAVTENGPKAAASTFGSAVMDWKFFEFGRQRKAIQAADYQFQGAKSGYDAAKLTLQSKVTRLYFEMMYSHANSSWAAQNVKRVKEILDLSVSLAKAGLKPGADTLLASSSYSQAIAYQKEWLGKYRASKINFSEVVPLVNFTLPQEAFSRYNAPLNTVDSVSSAHPYLQVLDKQVLFEKTQEEVASRKMLPSFSVLGGLSSRGSAINSNGTIATGISSGYNNYANNYLIGIGLSWNITGAYTTSLEKRRAQKTVQGSIAKYNLQKLQMNTSLSAVAERIIQQQAQLKENTLAFTKATEAFGLYLFRYESGLINLTELLQIQSLLQKSEQETIETTQTLWSLMVTQAEVSGDFNYLSTQFN